MPKLKSHRGASKRFKKTGKGFKHRGANRNHMLMHRSKKAKRQSRSTMGVDKADVAIVEQMLSGG